MKGKLNLFFCFHGVANVVRKCKIFFSLDHGVVNVVTNWNKFFWLLQPIFLSWSSSSEGSSNIKITFSRSWLENVAVKSLLLSSDVCMMDERKNVIFFLLNYGLVTVVVLWKRIILLLQCSESIGETRNKICFFKVLIYWALAY